MIKKIDKFLSVVSNWFMWVSYVGIVAIMVLIVIDVAMRRFLQAGIAGSYEIVERMLMIMIFAAFAYTQTQRGHIHVTLFLGKFPRVVGMIVFGLLGLLTTTAAVFCAYSLMVQGDYSLAAGTHTSVVKIPLYPFFYISAVLAYLFALTLLWDSIKCFIAIKNKELSDDIRSVCE